MIRNDYKYSKSVTQKAVTGRYRWLLWWRSYTYYIYVITFTVDQSYYKKIPTDKWIGHIEIDENFVSGTASFRTIMTDNAGNVGTNIIHGKEIVLQLPEFECVSTPYEEIQPEIIGANILHS